MGGSASRGRHHLGISIDFIQPAAKTPANTQGQRSRTHANPRSVHTQNFSVPDGAGSWSSPSRQGGRWSAETTTFLRLLPQTKARTVPNILRKVVEASLLSRWSAILTLTAQHAFAASFLDVDCAGTSNTDGDTPSISQLLSEAPPTPAHQPSPSPPLRS